MPASKKWISRTEAAQILGVHPQTVTNYADRELIQVKGTNRYPLYWRPEVEALAADATYQEANAIHQRAVALKQEAQELLQAADTEYRQRERSFQDAFAALSPSGKFDYNNLYRYRKLLRAMITKSGISDHQKTVLLGVLNFEVPGELMRRTGYPSRSFNFQYKNALKKLIQWYSAQNEVLESYRRTIGELNAQLRGKDQQIQMLGEALKDQERSEAIRQAASSENRRELILRTVHPYNLRLRDYGLSVRTYNCVHANNIETVGDLCQLPRSEVMKFRNLGRKSLVELESLLERYGLGFGHDPLSQITPPQPAPEPASETATTDESVHDKIHELPGHVFITDEEPWTLPLIRTAASVRLCLLLRSDGILTLGQLARKTRQDLLKIRGLGDHSLREAVRLLRRYGIEI